jgi:hypothetical protein
MREKLGILVLAMILCATLSITTTALLLQATPSNTTLYVSPPIIEDPTILPNDTIVIRIMLSNVTNMKSCEFNLTFSPSLLSIQRVTKLTVQGQYPESNIDVDDIGGYIWVSLSYKNALTTTTDTGLVEIEFFVRDYGSTPLHFENSMLKDNSGIPITHGTQDGFVHVFIRNIAIKEIYLPCNETYVGRIIPINVTVLNDGDMPENFNVSLYYDTMPIEVKNVTNLLPKENITLTFDWNTSSVAPRAEPYTIKAEASTVPYEANVDDNKLTGGTIKLKIVGDVNGDGAVNIDDLIAWDNAYGSHVGEPNWNEQANLNEDNVIDQADAIIILEHYKETM